MAQVFKPRANALTFVLLSGILVTVIGIVVISIGLGASPYATGVNETPSQPVPFSHKHHAGRLGIDCRYCHTGVERSAFAGIPPSSTCMTCHSQLWTDADMLAPVRESVRRQEPLRWTRVHDLADFVYFNHRAHVMNGVGCESCHGRVDRMPLTQQKEPLTMQWCLDCHRNPAPALRPRNRITAMGYRRGPGDPSGEELMERYGIHADTLMECHVCHR